MKHHSGTQHEWNSQKWENNLVKKKNEWLLMAVFSCCTSAIFSLFCNSVSSLTFSTFSIYLAILLETSSHFFIVSSFGNLRKLLSIAFHTFSSPSCFSFIFSLLSLFLLVMPLSLISHSSHTTHTHATSRLDWWW